MIKKIIFLFSISCFFIGVIFAQSAEKELNRKLSQFHTMTADFHQIIRDVKGTILQESSGKMAIQRPGKFLWDVQKPIRQFIVTDSEKVWIYEPDLEQVIIRPLNNDIGETPIMLLANPTIRLQENFSVVQLPSNKGIDRFKLVPKNKRESFETIVVSFKQNNIVKMTLMNSLGQTTELNFSQVVLNSITSKLSKELFSFQVPRGVDVIQ